ncbi:inosine-5'-monophosphate dehydrogenase [Faunimonas pinastri]|uniref:Inosine-5'-monophosphate dehydrogenase n=1 Tax=Faunimonas pinastri TaxID=1855383 RepID=A0A1H9NBA6_9HYPH|nr:IMP dehydrogenase [Faunimonas pinastri]SER32663.1 inosine-5'-monophosphate dehydrogenase [Faunimonas pinastri]
MPNERMHKFFASLSDQGLMLTYSDVRLRTTYSEVLPPDANLASRISRNVELRVPLISSPMDTVTTASMAIAMAEAGGIGVVHRGLSPEAQAKEIARVKNHLNARIEAPITVQQDETVSDVLTMRERKRYRFHSFPVLDGDGKVVGLVTGSDFDFCQNLNAPVRSIMTPLADLTVGQPGMGPREAFDLMNRQKKKVLLLIGENARLAGLYAFSDMKRIFARAEGQQSEFNVDAKGQLRVAAAVGVGEKALERAALLSRKHCDVFHIDTAHGDSRGVIETLKTLKAQYPDVDIIAGNVSSGDSAKRLADAGADGILVGQGPGSICTTRVIAGIGVPQVSAIYDCVRAIEGSGVPIVADGGIGNSGDMVIALAVGASTVMLGRLLAGTEEAPGETRFLNGMQVKDYRGMGSLGAMRESSASRERYGQASVLPQKLVPEGVEGIVPYRGPVRSVLDQYLGGIRSGMGYIGARTVSELSDRAEIFRITNAGLAESHPHDIAITTEAPNYQRS